jgi:hypothetical protein
MKTSLDPRALDGSVLQVISLFEGPLQSVSFPDVDRAALGELAEGVRRAADEVTAARARLDAAELTLGERQQALLARCQRAVGYARVYAAEDAELTKTLDAISLPRTTPRTSLASVDAGGAEADGAAPARRRGRPRRSRDGAPLFEASADEALAAE